MAYIGAQHLLIYLTNYETTNNRLLKFYSCGTIRR